MMNVNIISLANNAYETQRVVIFKLFDLWEELVLFLLIVGNIIMSEGKIFQVC